MAQAQLNKDYLKGLVYRTSKSREVKDESGSKTVHTPVERPVRLDDVLSWRDRGDSVVIVTADGKKHEVTKTPAQIKADEDARKKAEDEAAKGQAAS